MVNQKYLKGSYTVEAAIIFPFIIFIICAIMYLGLYMHDKVLLQCAVDKLILNADSMTKHILNEDSSINYKKINNRDILRSICGDFSIESEMLEKYIMERLDLYIIKIDTIDIKINNSKVYINIIYRLNIPIHVNRYFNTRTIYLELTGNIQNPSEFLRIFSVLEEEGSQIKGIEEVINKLRKYIN